MSAILQKFVDHELIKVGDEDFEKLKVASSSLSKSVFRKKDQVIKYTLVAFDPDIDPNEPALRKTEELVKKQSPTILSHSKDKPRTILRAVILEALYTRALNDIDYARIIWLTSSSTFIYYNLGNEKQILKEILQEIGERVEQDSLKEWGLIGGIDLQELEELQIKLKGSANLESQMASFKESFKNAIQFKNWGGENPASPHNGNQNWGNYFSDHGSNAISNFVKQAIQFNNKNLDQVATRINEYFQRLQPYFEKIGEQAIRGVKSVNNRSQLLWWKESLYSQSTKQSYREIQPELLPVVMAFDIHSIINQSYPVSVDYFLKETIGQLIDKNMSKVSLAAFLNVLNEDNYRDFIKNRFPKPIDKSGRSSLLNYIISMVNDEADGSKELKSKFGIDSKKQVYKTELAVWLFHDFQALRIASN